MEEDDFEMEKYYRACVNQTTGEAENCIQQVPAQNIRCLNNCAMELCPHDSLCSGDTNDPLSPYSSLDCEEEKWCRQYEVVDLLVSNQFGFVPRTYHCHDLHGRFTQNPGAVLQPDGSLGDCLFGDQKTRVNRMLVGEYAYCDGIECEDVFVGGFRSVDYDPRYRTWYMTTKQLQRPTWSQPYPFFSTGDLGITFSHPIYSQQPKLGMLNNTTQQSQEVVFEGVLGVDYTFQDLGAFLNSSYGVSKEIVAIYERAAPHFLVASSTSFKAAAKVLKNDKAKPCPYEFDDGQHCTVIRRSMADFASGEHAQDPLVYAAYITQENQDYPQGLVSVKVSDIPGTQAYASQSSFYSAGDKNLEWIIVVISPVERSSVDAVTKEDSLFGVVCTIAGLGFLLCIFMLVSFLSQRKSRAVILADWRFTSAFLTGCALCNLASLALLGDNTEALCILRMWSYHLVFALALSPLFVKVYRIYMLVGSTDRNPAIISSTVAFAMTMPIVLIQVTILTIFTIIDPAQPEESILIEDSGATQTVECKHDTPAFLITVLTFEIGLVLVGCALAFAARKVDPGFGQSTELLFSMFNIAFIGTGIGIITLVMDVDQPGKIVLYTMGSFWSTVYSSAAFVVPRLLQARNDTEAKARSQPQTNRTEGKARAMSSEDSNAGHHPSRPLSEKDITRWSAVVGDHPNRPLSEKDITGWSAVQNDDDYATGTRSLTSQIE